MKKVYVYTLVNNNGQVEYVGETIYPIKRMQQHKSKYGKFYNRNDIKMQIIKEFDSKTDAYYFQCELQKQYGFDSDYETHSANAMKSAYNRTEINAFDYKTGKFIGYFKSQYSAAVKLKLHQPAISLVLKGKVNQTGGYIFKLKRNY